MTRRLAEQHWTTLTLMLAVSTMTACAGDDQQSATDDATSTDDMVGTPTTDVTPPTDDSTEVPTEPSSMSTDVEPMSSVTTDVDDVEPRTDDSTETDDGDTVVPEEPPPPPPPSVDNPDDLLAPWGSVIRLEGEGLGSAARQGVSLKVGTLVLTPSDDERVSEWSEELIEFRVPFPFQGEIAITTPQGEVVAGSFTSEWQLSEGVEIADGVQTLASISPGPGEILLAIDTTPIDVLHFDGESWSRASLTGDEIAPETFRFFMLADGEVRGFGLSESSPAAVVEFDAVDWEGETLAYEVSDDPNERAIAGGPNGASVWTRGELGWHGYFNSDGTWVIDILPVEQPSGLSKAKPVTIDDGDLFIVYAVDTGNFFDDHETPYYRHLLPGALSFEDRVVAGTLMDDHLTSLTPQDHGSGFTLEYCGSDSDPLVLTGTAYRCRASSFPRFGDPVLRGPKPSDGARYAFTDNLVGIAHCRDEETLVNSHYDEQDGYVMTWPCVGVEALQIDAAGEWLPIIRHQNEWIPLLSFEHAATDPVGGSAPVETSVDGGFAGDAGAPTDAGADAGDAGR